jgi:2,3-bisphosphoglycerate-dependent phosphoglycerate mutase
MDTTTSHHLTFLRHGQSVANAQNIRQGQSDFPLTELGREQACILATRWQAEGKTFDKVITSPLSRASQTAEIIAEALDLPYDTDPIWMERDNGKLAGLTFEEAKRLYPRPDFIEIYQPIGITGESQWELFLRAGRAVHDLMQRPPGKYLIVGHGGLMNMAIYAILGIIPQADFQGPHFRFHNAAFTTLEYNSKERRWRVLGLNDQDHLGVSYYLEKIKLPPSGYMLTLLRHGESQSNSEGLLQGILDSPLSPQGIEQAHILANRWQAEGRHFDQAISSPLSRTRQTAEIVTQALGTPISFDDDWKEQDIGELSGTTFQDIRRGLLPPSQYQPYSPVGETGESRWDTYFRAGHALQAIFERPPGHYLVVAHGGIFNMAVAAALGVSPQTNVPPPGFLFDNTAFATLYYEPEEHYWGVLRLNDQAHLLP